MAKVPREIVIKNELQVMKAVHTEQVEAINQKLLKEIRDIKHTWNAKVVSNNTTRGAKVTAAKRSLDLRIRALADEKKAAIRKLEAEERAAVAEAMRTFEETRDKVENDHYAANLPVHAESDEKQKEAVEKYAAEQRGVTEAFQAKCRPFIQELEDLAKAEEDKQKNRAAQQAASEQPVAQP